MLRSIANIYVCVCVMELCVCSIQCRAVWSFRIQIHKKTLAIKSTNSYFTFIVVDYFPLSIMFYSICRANDCIECNFCSRIILHLSSAVRDALWTILENEMPMQCNHFYNAHNLPTHNGTATSCALWTEWKLKPCRFENIDCYSFFPLVLRYKTF